MNLKLFIRARLNYLGRRLAERRVLKTYQGLPGTCEIVRHDWLQSLQNPTTFYQRAFCHFHWRLASELKHHRYYFRARRRGFGEDAFHSMWFLLHNEFRPKSFLEIGVYRGQVLTLISLLQQRVGDPCAVVGISPFLPAGDSVSNYRDDIDYYDDTLANFDHFGLPKPELLKARSTDPSAVDLIKSRSWDCIYIDGNHDYEVAKADWVACSSNVKAGGLIVLDDAALSTTYAPPGFGTRGHPGPSRVADEIDRSQFQEILQVGHNRVFQRVQT
jgi:hypothetical protein